MIKVKPSPDIEQLLITLKRGKGKHIPLAELGIHPLIKEKLIGRPVVTLQDDIDFWHTAGYDYIKLQPKADFDPDKKGTDKNVVFYQDGTVLRKWASESNGLISTRGDFENYRFPSASDFSYKDFERVKELLPDGMGVIGQYGDIFTMTWEMMGFEAFSLALFEDPELIDEINNVVGGLVLNMFEHFAGCPAVDALWYSDDIAFAGGLLVSPDVLGRYFFPWLKKIGDLAKSSGKPLIYHSDGILYDVADELKACGVDALHPIEPKAMDIAEVKMRHGKDFCLIGNVDVDILARGTADQIEKIVKENVEKAGYNGGYCIGSGNSVPEYVNFENYLALLNAAKTVVY